jgi:outer membrane protein assembly factor BamB
MDGTGNFPDARPPLDWSATRNVAWSTAMPSWSNASPILVGGRIFVLSEPDTLICVNAADGKILWQKANPVADTIAAPLDPEPPFLQAISRQRETQAALRQKEYALLAARRAASEAAPDDARARDLDSRTHEVERMRHELAALIPVMPPQINVQTGLTSPTPTSDGSSIFVMLGTGVVASYDLDGHRRWIRFVDLPRDTNGQSSSPVLAGDKLLLLINDLIALDTSTGEVAWRADVPTRYGTPIVFRVGSTDLAITPSGHCVRVEDGVIVASGIGDLEYASPLVHDRMLYMIDYDSHAFRIPEAMSAPLAFQEAWSLHLKGARFYSSPLLLDGLIYTIARNQLLSVVDASTGTLVYSEKLSLGSQGGVNGVFTSIVQGGSYLFASGLGGASLVFKPGRQLEKVRANELETFRGTPIFDGDRMYVRGYEKLYAISSPAQPDGAGETSPSTPPG